MGEIFLQKDSRYVELELQYNSNNNNNNNNNSNLYEVCVRIKIMLRYVPPLSVRF